MHETRVQVATPASRAWPRPVPHGWYSAGYSREFAAGTVHARRYVEQDLVIWRSADGTPHVMDAYCPHLGAHLAVGGCVEGDRIVCPFHRWEFDAQGRNVRIPYVEASPDGTPRRNAKARLRSYPTVERNGMVMFWYHPDPDRAPMWEIPELEVTRGGDFDEAYEFVVETAWQEIAENSVDGAHFQYVHGTPAPGTVASADFSGPVRQQRVDVTYNTRIGPVDGYQVSGSYGPGFGTVHFHIFGDAYLITSNTPIERDRTHVRFAWTYGDDEVSRRTGARFAEEVRRQFEQDIPIWENKRFVADPALAPNEKPITQFRAWAAKFYDEGDPWSSTTSS